MQREDEGSCLYAFNPMYIVIKIAQQFPKNPLYLSTSHTLIKSHLCEKKSAFLELSSNVLHGHVHIQPKLKIKRAVKLSNSHS